MRNFSFLCLMILGISCASVKPGANSNILNGTWIPVKQEIGGNELPAAAFASQKLIINDTTYTLYAESVDKGIVKYTYDNMDIYGKEGVNASKHFTAIYKIENNLVTICYNLLGTAYPAAYDTKGKPFYFLSVFKKN